MKKSTIKLFVLFIIGFFVIGGTLFLTKYEHVIDNTMSPNDRGGNDEVVVVTDLKDAQIDAIYSDGYKSLDDLIINSDLVVQCTIKDQQYHKSGFSIISTLNVVKIASGDVNVAKADIDVLQIKGDNELKPNKEYILFLGKQDQVSNQYYIVGYGTQGIFVIDNNQITPVDEIMISEYSNLSLTKNLSSSKSNGTVDNFINYIDSVKN